MRQRDRSRVRVDDVSLDLAVGLTGDELFALFGLSPPPARSTPKSLPPEVDLTTRVRGLLERRGWRVETAARYRDEPVDLTAARLDDAGEMSSLWIGCEEQTSPVGVETVRALHRALLHQHGAHGVVVTRAGLTEEAHTVAADCEIAVRDEARLIALEGADDR